MGNKKSDIELNNSLKEMMDLKRHLLKSQGSGTELNMVEITIRVLRCAIDSREFLKSRHKRINYLDHKFAHLFPEKRNCLKVVHVGLLMGDK